MTQDDIFDDVCRRLRDAMAAKGLPVPVIDRNTPILGGPLPLDSLDLAGIVVELETATGRDPFKDGFINFRTIGELANLFACPQ